MKANITLEGLAALISKGFAAVAEDISGIKSDIAKKIAA